MDAAHRALWGLQAPVSLGRTKGIAMPKTSVASVAAGTASGLNDLARPADYASANKHLFPSLPSLEWFIRSHKRELIAAEALAVVNSRQFIVREAFDRVVRTTGARRAELVAARGPRPLESDPVAVPSATRSTSGSDASEAPHRGRRKVQPK